MRPLIGITMGDPSGVGPEILLKAAVQKRFHQNAIPIVFGDYNYLVRVQKHVFKKNKAVSKLILKKIDIDFFSLPRAQKKLQNELLILDLNNIPAGKLLFGKSSIWGGAASGEYIHSAVWHVLNGKIAAVVTLPINKVSFKLGGWGKKFIGHTEMLAALSKTKKFALMLLHGSLRAVHVTQHIPLANVARTLNIENIFSAITLAHMGLKQMGIAHPRIAVCGLNPHAGDGGLMGQEERLIIEPAIRAARKKGIRVEGPISADTVWPKVQWRDYDVGIAMYHDQGQIPIKFSSFQQTSGKSIVGGVNVTLGIPFVRTSVAHGTAYDIAGQGIASENSLLAAFALAVQMQKYSGSMI